jgi:Zn-dependent M28 family amino/carboxypeptidase
VRCRLKRGGRFRAGLSVWAASLACAAAFACAAEPSGFNGEQAFQDLKHLVSFGPRPSGSPALAQTRQWLIRELRAAGARVEEDSFVASTPVGPIVMANLIAKFPGAGRETVIVAGHYDTKRFDDFRFLGANDGGSSAALLVELARVLGSRKNRLNYWLVFFDGEEAVRNWTDTDSVYGSRHLVENLTASGELSRIEALILVDMIGDAQLNIPRESNSTPWLSDLVWGVARRLGYGRYFVNSEQSIGDDHQPFLEAGVAAVDLIDFDYGPGNSYWHTAQDTLDHCSAASLNIVGRVVAAALDELEKAPHR